MTDFYQVLFYKVFEKVDNGPNQVNQLPESFNYFGKNFEYIKKHYKSYSFDELRDILTLYRITMDFADYRDKKSTVPFFKHKENVDVVLDYLDNMDDDDDSEDSYCS